MSYMKMLDRIRAIPSGEVMAPDGLREAFPEMEEQEFQDTIKYAFGAAMSAGLVTPVFTPRVPEGMIVPEEERNWGWTSDLPRLSGLAPSDILVAFRRLEDRTRPTDEMWADYLRGAAISEVSLRGITREELADRLNILPPAVEIVLKRQKWSLVFAIKFAEAVGLKIKLEIGR